MSNDTSAPAAADPKAATRPNAFDPGWPGDPEARWPQGCYVWDVGMHPKLPWLTLACNKDDFGAIMVIDAHSGSMVSATTSGESTGWANEGLVLWDATGTRLCTNADGSGIAVLEAAAFAGLNHTTEGRDGGTFYAWVDHRIYTDTNHLFDPKHDEGWSRFELAASREILWDIDGFRWNANIDAVVGRIRAAEGSPPETRRLMAYAPARDAVVYDRALGDVGRIHWSPDGRWVLTHERAPSGGPAHVIVIDGNDGRETRRFLPKHGFPGRSSVSNRGDVIVTSSMRPSPRDAMAHALELWRTGVGPVELAVRDLVEVAWSPDSHGVALLDERGTITVFDVATAKALTTIAASEPTPPASLPDWAKPAKPFQSGQTTMLWVSPDRLAVVGGYYASIYSLDGSRIAQFIAP